MRKYEVPALFMPVLAEDVNKKLIPQIAKIVKELGGQISKKEGYDWGRKHLEYEIDGNEEGYYVFFDLEVDPAQVNELRDRLKREVSDLLRFLIIREDQI